MCFPSRNSFGSHHLFPFSEKPTFPFPSRTYASLALHQGHTGPGIQFAPANWGIGHAVGDRGSSLGLSGQRRLVPQRSYRLTGGKPGSQLPPVWPRPQR